ncbi:MAG: hypothetical protein AB7G62_12270 [Magnetospirillum sp.]
MVNGEALKPNELGGLKTFFTDLDHSDRERDPVLAVRGLKVQLLLKDRVVVGASSMFHQVWLDMFKEHGDLVGLLGDGVLVPALQDKYPSVDAFFDHNPTYGNEARRLFVENTARFLPWNVDENSGWFRERFRWAISDPRSVLRVQTGIPDAQAEAVGKRLDELVEGDDFFRRGHAVQAVRDVCPEHETYVSNFVNLVYRISGARVVKAEGHFPQANLVKVGITASDHKVADSSIFWDMFVDAILSNLSSATAMTMERLDRLGFADIAKLRREELFRTFREKFDGILAEAKGRVSADDPEALFFNCMEIDGLAENLRRSFMAEISRELKARAIEDKVPGIWEMASATASYAVGGPFGAVVGLLSTLKAVPEMTTVVNSRLADSIRQRLEMATATVMRMVGLSHRRKTALIRTYQRLLVYGL